jgi:hypothetical protein
MDDNASIKSSLLGAAPAAAAGVPPLPLQPLQLQRRHSLHPLPPPPGTTTRRTRTTYLCINRRITSVGANPGELFFSKPLACIFDKFALLIQLSEESQPCTI